MRNYFINRLSEASTWRGAILLITALGVQISPELQEAIVSFGLAAAGLLAVAVPDLVKRD